MDAYEEGWSTRASQLGTFRDIILRVGERWHFQFRFHVLLTCGQGGNTRSSWAPTFLVMCTLLRMHFRYTCSFVVIFWYRTSKSKTWEHRYGPPYRGGGSPHPFRAPFDFDFPCLVGRSCCMISDQESVFFLPDKPRHQRCLHCGFRAGSGVKRAKTRIHYLSCGAT